jgi:hypothetical protein
LSQTPPLDSPQPVSGQPWSSPSGDSMAVEPDRPPLPPTFQPGQAPLPQPPEPAYPPTTQFLVQPGSVQPGSVQPGSVQPGSVQPGSAQPGSAHQGAPGMPARYGPGYPPPGYPPPGYPPPGYPPPGYGQQPPRKSNAPLVAVIIAVALLLCGGGATAAVLITRAVTDRAKEVVKPITPPALPTQAPSVPDVPGLPTELPNLPGGTGRPITVTYEVTGDGPAEILYTGALGEGPKRVSNADLPWRLTTTIEGAAFVSVTAARLDGDDGSISCRTTIDDDSAAQSTRQGAFAAVSCSKFVYH